MKKEEYMFFACPALTGKGLKYDQREEKIVGNYKKEISKSAQKSIEKIEKAGLLEKSTLIFAEADNLIVPGDFSRVKIAWPEFPHQSSFELRFC